MRRCVCCPNNFGFQVVMQCGEHVILHQRKLISLLNQVLAVFALDLSTANSLRNNREFRG